MSLRKIVLITISLFLILNSGCFIDSVHPYYKVDQLTTNPAIEGHWILDDEYYEAYYIEKNPDDMPYTMYLYDIEGWVATYELHLAQIDDILIADIFPVDLVEKGDRSLTDLSMLWELTGHACFIINSASESGLNISIMTLTEWYKLFSDDDREEIERDWSTQYNVNSYDVSTETLQRLIIETHNDENYWTEVFLPKAIYF